nr:MAG TPA: hypothetical protein [Caudoviricetes sp.]
MRSSERNQRTMAYKLGLDAKIFHGAAGSKAATEMSNVTDVTLNLENGRGGHHDPRRRGLANHRRDPQGGVRRVRDDLGHGRQRIQRDPAGLLRKLGVVALRLGRRGQRPGRGLRRYVVLALRTAGGGAQGIGDLQADPRQPSPRMGERRFERRRDGKSLKPRAGELHSSSARS